MNEELQKVVESEKLSPEAAEKIDQLAPGAFCQHKSWGFGKVAEWNLLTSQIFIDFDHKKSHPMQLEYAAETLVPVPADHVRAQLAEDREAVMARVKEDPAGLGIDTLRSLGGKATTDQISAVFVPHAMDAPAFKKFWDSAKKKLKSNAHVHFPGKKSEPIELHDAPVDQGAKLVTQFRDARHPKDQVIALDAIVKSSDDVADAEEVQKLVLELESAASKGLRLYSVQALEMLLARDEICAESKEVEPGEDAPVVGDVLKGEQTRLPELFTSLPASKHRKVLSHFQEAFPDSWKERALDLALMASPRLVQEIARLFENAGLTEEFRDALDKWIRERRMSPEVLLWFCRERGGDFPELFTMEIFSAILASLEQDMLSDVTRGTKLHDLVMDDKTLVSDLFSVASLEDTRDAVRKLKLSTVFDDLDKRSLLARIIKLHPEVQGMVTGQEEERDDSLVVSWASLERRRKEYEDLINKQIPQNTKDISIARSYGDLRENFEFKSAKEQQRVLLRRKSDMEREMSASRGTNFDDIDTSKVGIGTTVELTEVDSGSQETYSILGAWDSIPEKGVVSYQAGIGQALAGKKVGDVAELQADSGTRKVRVEKIEAFKNLELLGTVDEVDVQEAQADTNT
ncbi:MAG: GreA/GreB family elongation factor [Chthoniobacterales bacterium]